MDVNEGFYRDMWDLIRLKKEGTMYEIRSVASYG